MTAPRKKLVDRALKILARAESPNRHEAALAAQTAAEFIQKHGITQAELDGRRADAQPAPKRSAGTVAEDPWREEVALAIGQRRGCRALRAQGQLVFDGPAAADAVSDFRRAVGQIEEECNRYWRSHGHGDRFAIDRVYRPVFLLAAACALSGREIARPGGVDVEEIIALARRLDGFTAVRSCIDLVLRSAVLDGALAGRGVALALDRMAADEVLGRTAEPADDQFVLASGLLFVLSNRPGSYATLFLRGAKLSFRGDVSAFDDARRRYVWGFSRGGADVGDRIVFATADREAVGEVSAKVTRVVARTARVVRDPSGEPLFVEGDGAHLRAV